MHCVHTSVFTLGCYSAKKRMETVPDLGYTTQEEQSVHSLGHS